jgi:hypothetical protein
MVMNNAKRMLNPHMPADNNDQEPETKKFKSQAQTIPKENPSE